MRKIRHGLNAQSIIGRHLDPSAWDAAWSDVVADRRQAARCAAQNLMRRDPARARRIVSAWRNAK
jgi:hypothetical protein